MEILNNIVLKPLTSMFVGGPAKYFVEVREINELVLALKFAKENKLPIFILGGGSNILVSDQGFEGLVIRMAILGKEILSETDEYLEIEVSAGESWDEFVAFAVNGSLCGIENMSHIPGSVGASVVQNIGCYGQEVSESIVSVDVIDLKTLKSITFSKSEMFFSYRKSRLNSFDKGKYVVIKVRFGLQKNSELNMRYGDISKYFNEHKDSEPNLKTLREAVIAIRDSKFPYPNKPTNGTVGSFWNADVITQENYEKIIEKLKEKGFESRALDMENKKNVFRVAQGYKVPYGLLIEVLGFKGKSLGGAKILETHSGIINNFTGEASAQDIVRLSNNVINAVFEEFGVVLRVEPEFVGIF